ncbi:MAG: carboxypeptidase M32 [Pseudomonadota bacterium]
MTAYERLSERFQKISDIGSASAILGWDRQVIMPDGGSESRTRTLAALSTLTHEWVSEPEVGDWLDEAEASPPNDAWKRANLRAMRCEYRNATAIPSDLVRALTIAENETEMAWRSARENDDFSALAGPLAKLVDLVCSQADALRDGRDLSRYNALLDLYDPGRTSEEIDGIFAVLEQRIPGLLEAALEKQNASEPAITPPGTFSTTSQKALGEAVMAALGFDFGRGRLDTSLHPFSGGLPDDSRITTRYDEADFTTSLMGVIHETGHAVYEQGLPKDWRGQPVGQSYGMTVHESQSLLFEMQVGRSPEFIGFLTPLVKEHFGVDGPAFHASNLKKLYHKVERGFIRVDADEITYPLHVILRYRLEQAMLAGDLSVADLPGAWNDIMAKLVGVTPPNDKLGCLQDIHWPSGAFGYFPTYTLGAIGAAQLIAAAREKLSGLMDEIAEGKIDKLLDWLRDEIHSKGKLTSPDAMFRSATGEGLDAMALISHLEHRYLDKS